MQIGKVPENVLKRSVFKQIKLKRDEVLIHPGVGEDCSVLELAPGEVFVLSTDPITGAASDIGTLAVRVTANDLASAGAEPVGILLSILLPQDAQEADLKSLMREIESACEPLNIEVIGGHTEVTPVVNQPVVTVTGVGKVKKDAVIFTKGARRDRILFGDQMGWTGKVHRSLHLPEKRSFGPITVRILWTGRKALSGISPW